MGTGVQVPSGRCPWSPGVAALLVEHGAGGRLGPPVGPLDQGLSHDVRDRGLVPAGPARGHEGGEVVAPVEALGRPGHHVVLDQRVLREALHELPVPARVHQPKERVEGPVDLPLGLDGRQKIVLADRTGL